MKETNTIENLFDELQNQFDIEAPKSGHKARFIEKLEGSSKTKYRITELNFWKPLTAIAATIIICLGVFQFANIEEEKVGLASVSPELSETQDFFTATISEEFKKLDAERSPLTEHIIYEAERQIKALEDDFSKLKIDLKQSGNDKRVVYAMITNYQNRIDILTNILDKIEDLKTTNYEIENIL